MSICIESTDHERLVIIHIYFLLFYVSVLNNFDIDVLSHFMLYHFLQTLATQEQYVQESSIIPNRDEKLLDPVGRIIENTGDVSQQVECLTYIYITYTLSTNTFAK